MQESFWILSNVFQCLPMSPNVFQRLPTSSNVLQCHHFQSKKKNYFNNETIPKESQILMKNLTIDHNRLQSDGGANKNPKPLLRILFNVQPSECLCQSYWIFNNPFSQVLIRESWPASKYWDLWSFSRIFNWNWPRTLAVVVVERPGRLKNNLGTCLELPRTLGAILENSRECRPISKNLDRSLQFSCIGAKESLQAIPHNLG